MKNFGAKICVKLSQFPAQNAQRYIKLPRHRGLRRVTIDFPARTAAHLSTNGPGYMISSTGDM